MDLALGAEVDSDEFSEPRRVVVLDGFSVSKALENGVTADQLFVQVGTVRGFSLHAAN